VEALRQSHQVKLAPDVLAPSSRGTPETLLLVGNDQRPPPKDNPTGQVLPHANEMLLVRIDPSKPTIAMLSIPRELRVTFTTPRGEVITNRINSAYTYGGIELMTRTIKRLLGISVNHVFVVTFPKFRRAVDEIGCVYMTVDRRYYHVNEPGGEQYFEINLQPGYQRLCGKEALEFVANRHEDTSLTRDARDQRFLLELKAQYGGTLFENREKFEHILGKAVETDLHGTGQVLDLLSLLIESQGKPVRQVPFHVNLLPTFDTASSHQIQESVQPFLGGTAAVPKQRLGQELRAEHSSHHARPPSLNLVATPQAALARARESAPYLPFALEYPRAGETYAGAAPELFRRYYIPDQRGVLHPIYVAVVNSGPLGEFYDVQGTNWNHPPMLSNPSQRVQVGSRTYELFYEAEHLRTVAWAEGGASYWVQNTLTNSISPRTMLAIADSTAPVVRASNGPTPRGPAPSSVRLPPRAAPATSQSTEIGALVGIASLVALGALACWVLMCERELRDLREQVARAMSLEVRRRMLMANAAALEPVLPEASQPDQAPRA
jgi:polyisoprenyl-teichoic acid--peptidoglycan teichoic acid transferase